MDQTRGMGISHCAALVPNSDMDHEIYSSLSPVANMLMTAGPIQLPGNMV
jgi:hypothetical protein